MSRTHMVGGHRKSRVREPAVAGLFYPDDPEALRADVEQRLAAHAELTDAHDRALIAPHAGYIYSGGVAADAYNRLRHRRGEIRRVVLIGPSHRVYLQGVAISPADAFATPLGDVEIDRELRTRLLGRGNVLSAEAPHAMEHSLEVHLPFLQLTLEHFTLVPLVVGVATPRSVADALLELWDVEDTLFIASSDLSHYLSYEEARRIDTATSEQILKRDPSLGFEQACGALPINALLTVARDRDLHVQEISRLNSGDTAGDRDRVVGYAAYAFH